MAAKMFLCVALLLVATIAAVPSPLPAVPSPLPAVPRPTPDSPIGIPHPSPSPPGPALVDTTPPGPAAPPAYLYEYYAQDFTTTTEQGVSAPAPAPQYTVPDVQTEPPVSTLEPLDPSPSTEPPLSPYPFCESNIICLDCDGNDIMGQASIINHKWNDTRCDDVRCPCMR